MWWPSTNLTTAREPPVSSSFFSCSRKRSSTNCLTNHLRSSEHSGLSSTKDLHFSSASISCCSLASATTLCHQDCRHLAQKKCNQSWKMKTDLRDSSRTQSVRDLDYLELRVLESRLARVESLESIQSSESIILSTALVVDVCCSPPPLQLPLLFQNSYALCVRLFSFVSAVSEVRDLFRTWREDNDRKSRDVVDMWEMTLHPKLNKLGDERLLVLEQVCIAALDCNRIDIADYCLHCLAKELPMSLRVRKLQAMKFEALEKYDDALSLLESIIKRDETNAAPRKRKIAILKARGRNMYLNELEFAKAAFCLEELLLHSPHNHLIHQRYAEIRYTQGGLENMELARAHFCQAVKLNPKNLRALYGIYLAATNISQNSKSAAPKKKEMSKLAAWALKQVQERYNQQRSEDTQISALDCLMGQLQITGASSSA
ncbi:hypothetical protein B566_EDAN002982 [Ephemera danica]|nr:hypothetical protein B566_EDAN002982 [Ephemera danica]